MTLHASARSLTAASFARPPGHRRAADLIPRPRRRSDATWQELADELHRAGVQVRAEALEQSSAPYELYRWVPGGPVAEVALAPWLDDHERVTVLEDIRRMLLSEA